MSKFVKTDAARYNRPAQIQVEAIYAANDQGGNDNASTWTTLCSPMIHLFSAPNGRGSSRMFQYMQLYPSAKHWAEFRYRSSVTIDGTMTLLHRNRRYQIIDAINMDEENKIILLPLIEYQSKGTKPS